jgi:glutamate--cysteine ligase catalytic subunit
VPDEVINEHPRFPFLSANIRERRGEKVLIAIPVFADTKTLAVDNGHTGGELRGDPDAAACTTVPAVPAGTDGGAAVGVAPDHIYMDAMAFGMGMACLQVTFQGSSIDEARDAYDPLTAISPYFLALTAATPIFRGYLSDIDARWSTISASVDDRTAEERTAGGAAYIPKSRYDSVSRYISSSHPAEADRYSDLGVPVNRAVKERLRGAGMDENLATHFAGLYVRDPLVVFADRVDLDNERQSDHFESIQSTNWQTVRFKPPPPDSDIGWRVEFRPMEVQFSDFENAAFTVFSVLLTRVLLSFDVNLYMPLSLVDENMRRAHARDAATSGKFWTRRHIVRRTTVPSGVCCTKSGGGGDGGGGGGSTDGAGSEPEPESEFVELSLDTIINGGDGFIGLIPLVETYLNSLTIDLGTRAIVDEYVKLVAGRASGRYATNAAWIRKFVREHPDYAHDSIVTETINHDLVAAVHAIGEGERDAPEIGDLLAVRKIMESLTPARSQSIDG